MSKIANKRTWNRRHEFQRKKTTRRQVGHPVYVYGRSGNLVKYLVFTHKPEEGKENDYEVLKYNIDKDDPQKSYVKKQFETNRVSGLRPPDKKYRIHDDDKETIKKYKK